MARRVDSVANFERYFITWRILGLIGNNNNKPLCRLYDILLTIVITVGFPLHLVIGIAYSENQEQFFSNVVISTSCVACTLKHIVYRIKLQKILQVSTIFAQMDERVRNAEDMDYYTSAMTRPCNFMTKFFFYLYGSIIVTGISTALITRQLIYPAFIPFDWQSSIFKYITAIAFQLTGLTLQIVQNLSNDVYGPLALCMLTGHVHLLSMRVARIGYEPQATKTQATALSVAEANARHNYNALTNCIKDFELLKSTTALVEDILTISYMVQFAVVGFNICVALIVLLFVADSMLLYAYYTLHVFAILIELFPCCYYGSMLELEFHNLSYAIFSSNWPMQPRPFRRNVIFFVEQSLKAVSLHAGGMVRINLDSFIVTCKTAYSFFTVMQSMK